MSQHQHTPTVSLMKLLARRQCAMVQALYRRAGRSWDDEWMEIMMAAC